MPKRLERKRQIVLFSQAEIRELVGALPGDDVRITFASSERLGDETDPQKMTALEVNIIRGDAQDG